MAGIDNYTKLMLHCEGVDNGTVFTDSSFVARTISNPNIITKTDIKKFGVSSAYFNGSTGSVDVADSDDFSFGSGNFTIDCWIYPTESKTYSAIYSDRGAAGQEHQVFIYTQHDYYGGYFAVNLTRASDKFQYELTTTANITLNAWQHVALVRNGSIATMYKGGVSIGSVNVGTTVLNNPAGPLHIGHDAGATPNRFKGYMDEFRISKGIARWTGNFTPPASAYSTNKITGYTTEEATISIYKSSDNSLITYEVKSAGNYSVDNLPDSNAINIMAIPTDTTKAPKVFSNVLPTSD